MNYSKIGNLVNLNLTCKHKRGFENWKTRYGSGDPFRIGKLKDFKKSEEDEGNFEVCVPVKGQKRADWDWQVEKFDRQKWDNSFSWLFLNGSEEHRVELTWLQNKNLTEVLPNDFPNTGVEITPRISDKTVDFEFVGNAPESQDVREQTAQCEAESGGVATPSKTLDEREAAVKDEVDIDSLPF